MIVEKNFLSTIFDITNHRHFIAYCFFFYFLTRALLIIFVPVEQFSDSAWYYSRAVSISEGLGYSENGLPTAYWPVGWPAALALVFWLFEPTPVVGQIFNLILSCITFFLVIELGRIIFKSEFTARLAVLLLALYPNNIAYVQSLMSEIFFTTMLLLGCYLYLVWLAAITHPQQSHSS